LIGDERDDDKRERRQRGDSDPVLADRKYLLIRRVGRLELPCFAVKP